MPSFSIWVDADSCQSKARNILLNTALKYNIPVFYVANRPIPFSIESTLFKMIVCEKKKDEADSYIEEHCSLNDITITRDLLLAQKLLNKDRTAINDRGIIFTQKTLEKMLKERELSMQMAALGIRNGKSFSTYTSEDLENFSQTLARLVQEKQITVNL